MAGPFVPTELDSTNPIPLDKKLDADWVESLFKRGQPTTYQGWDELKYIGMPAGGIAAGTVYLGGDGKLWCWDIFNEHHEGCIPNQISGISELAPHAAANHYHVIHQRSMNNIVSLFNETFGFFVQEEDPNHLNAIGVGDVCYIDQVMGQWWAFNLGLGRLYDGDKIRSALNRLWDHNFCPDMGLLRDSIKAVNLRGRPYALAGDAGLVMCTWPQGGKRDDWERHWQYGYFNECMSGFEYEAAGHMIWESDYEPKLLEKGLAITRAIHDRYHASMRNPYNEIECSDHYARAMASYGVFLAACGYEYDGPKGHIGFAPRLNPEKYCAAFTASEAWGTITQTREPGVQT